MFFLEHSSFTSINPCFHHVTRFSPSPRLTAPYRLKRQIPAGLDAASSLSIVHSLKKLTQLGLTSVGKLETKWMAQVVYVICHMCDDVSCM